jgi:hypothetical protein
MIGKPKKWVLAVASAMLSAAFSAPTNLELRGRSVAYSFSNGLGGSRNCMPK